MSTEYTLIRKRTPDAEYKEVLVLEHSNVFDIGLQLWGGPLLLTQEYLNDFTLEDLKAIRDRLTQVIGYFED